MTASPRPEPDELPHKVADLRDRRNEALKQLAEINEALVAALGRDDNWVVIKQAVALGPSDATIRRWAATGEIGSIRTSTGRLLVSLSDVIRRTRE